VQDPKVSLCVGITGSLGSATRGAAAQWIVTAWTTGGNIPDAIVRLQASPASVTPQFSFGCGSNDSTAACDLGAMDSKSAQRQLQAQVTVPATSTLSAVTLTVIGSAAHLKTDPEATAVVAITGPVIPAATTSPLPIGSLPDVPTPTPSLTPGGNAAGLFPTINPSPSTSAGKKAITRSVADTAALPEGASVIGAQLVGLGALAVAFVLAVTRLTIRRRPSLATGGPTGGGYAAGSPPESGTPDSKAGTPDAQPADAQPETPDAQPGIPAADNNAPPASDGPADPAPEA
jgi:hypothetical protein